MVDIGTKHERSYTFTADHWDGFDVDPAADLVPAGETHWAHTAFHTVTPN